MSPTATAARIEALLQEADDGRCREAVRLLMHLYGDALAHVMEAADEETQARLAADPLVGSLLVLHGLHPLDVRQRVERALDGVRPYMASHGGAVTLLSVDDDVVRLRLEGNCHGCPGSAVTMKLAVERAIEEWAPEVARVEVAHA